MPLSDEFIKPKKISSLPIEKEFAVYPNPARNKLHVYFPENSVAGFVTHAPDSMRIQCGRFRAMNF